MQQGVRLRNVLPSLCHKYNPLPVGKEFQVLSHERIITLHMNESRMDLGSGSPFAVLSLWRYPGRDVSPHFYLFKYFRNVERGLVPPGRLTASRITRFAQRGTGFKLNHLSLCISWFPQRLSKEILMYWNDLQIDTLQSL